MDSRKIIINRSIDTFFNEATQYKGVIIGCGGTPVANPSDVLSHSVLHPYSQYYTIDIDPSVSPDIVVDLNEHDDELLFLLKGRFSHAIVERFPTVIFEKGKARGEFFWVEVLTPKLLSAISHISQDDSLSLFILSTKGYFHLKDRNVFSELKEAGFDAVLPCNESNIFMAFKLKNMIPSRIVESVREHSSYIDRYMKGDIISESRYTFNSNNPTFFPVFFELDNVLDEGVTVLDELILRQGRLRRFFDGLYDYVGLMKQNISNCFSEKNSDKFEFFTFISPRHVNAKLTHDQFFGHQIINDLIDHLDGVLLYLHANRKTGGGWIEMNAVLEQSFTMIEALNRSTLERVLAHGVQSAFVLKIHDTLSNMMIACIDARAAFNQNDVDLFFKCNARFRIP